MHPWPRITSSAQLSVVLLAVAALTASARPGGSGPSVPRIGGAAPMQYMSMCLATTYARQDTHYFPEDHEGVFLLQHVHASQYRSGRFSSGGGIALPGFGKMTVNVDVVAELSSGVRLFNTTWVVDVDTSKQRSTIARFHELLDRWIRSVRGIPLVLTPSVAVVPMSPNTFAAAVEDTQGTVLFPITSLYMHDYVSENSGSRFYALLAERFDMHGSSYIPALFPVIEAMFIKQPIVVDVHCMLALNAFSVQIHHADAAPLSAFVSKLVLGQRVFMHARLSPAPSAAGTVNKYHMASSFLSALESGGDWFQRDFPNATADVHLLCRDDGRGCCPPGLIVGSNAFVTIRHRHMSAPWSECVVDRISVDRLLDAVHLWRLPNDALVAGVVGVSVSQPRDSRSWAPLPFVTTECASSPLPPPGVLLLMSRVAFISVLLVLFASATATYLLAGYIIWLVASEHVSALPSFVHIMRLPTSLHLVYLWPTSLHDDPIE